MKGWNPGDSDAANLARAGFELARAVRQLVKAQRDATRAFSEALTPASDSGEVIPLRAIDGGRRERRRERR